MTDAAAPGLHTILVVEDEPALRDGLRDALESEGYAVLTAPDGVKGLHLGLTADPDLVVLDLMLPGMDGFEVLRRLRADAVETPVLVLTARGLEEDKVRGLRIGADDYLVKPFGLPELLARVASRLRAWDRERGRSGRERLRLGPVTVDFASRTVARDGDAFGLTPQECALLRFFLVHEGRRLARGAARRRLARRHAADQPRHRQRRLQPAPQDRARPRDAALPPLGARRRLPLRALTFR